MRKFRHALIMIICWPTNFIAGDVQKISNQCNGLIWSINVFSISHMAPDETVSCWCVKMRRRWNFHKMLDQRPPAWELDQSVAQSPLTLVEENGVGGIVSGNSYIYILYICSAWCISSLVSWSPRNMSKEKNQCRARLGACRTLHDLSLS